MDEYMEALQEARTRALEAIGAKCAGYADRLAPRDTGRLHNSITWATKKSEGRNHTYSDDGRGRNKGTYSETLGTGVPEDAVCVGTNVEYAYYQELGTSKIDAHPFLTPAVLNHLDEYKRIALREMRNG
jgi:HK97 gp10 family phage protein